MRFANLIPGWFKTPWVHTRTEVDSIVTLRGPRLVTNGPIEKPNADAWYYIKYHKRFAAKTAIVAGIIMVIGNTMYQFSDVFELIFHIAFLIATSGVMLIMYCVINDFDGHLIYNGSKAYKVDYVICEEINVIGIRKGRFRLDFCDKKALNKAIACFAAS